MMCCNCTWAPGGNPEACQPFISSKQCSKQSCSSGRNCICSCSNAQLLLEERWSTAHHLLYLSDAVWRSDFCSLSYMDISFLTARPCCKSAMENVEMACLGPGSRLAQIVEWCGGEDFDGALVLDECHVRCWPLSLLRLHPIVILCVPEIPALAGVDPSGLHSYERL